MKQTLPPEETPQVPLILDRSDAPLPLAERREALENLPPVFLLSAGQFVGGVERESMLPRADGNRDEFFSM
jgi:hypothetical protein